LITAVVLAGLTFYPAFASTLDDLYKQKDQLQKEQQKYQSAAGNKEKEAKTIAAQITQLESDIQKTEAEIQNTSTQITDVTARLDQLNKDIEVKNAELVVLKQKLNSAIVEIYRSSSRSDWELLFGFNSLSDAINQTKYVESVEAQAKSYHDQTLKVKNELDAQKSEAEKKKAELDSLKNQQESYKKSAESQRSYKDRLLGMTVEQQKQYLSLVAEYQDKINSVQAQMNRLRGRSSWGTQIVSGSGISWYYTQTGNYTRLGPSPFTVDQYGCLITSVAMIATYYGHHITPTDIATTYGTFNEGGYLLGLSSAIGVSVGGSQSINWSEVDSQISSGHPVIVSIYLPSVGAINSDGSSHFVVIYGRSGSTYLMADPIGPGRGYNLDQTRSMKIVRD